MIKKFLRLVIEHTNSSELCFIGCHSRFVGNPSVSEERFWISQDDRIEDLK